ncbi:MAG: SulP family inorganic anion transporter [Bdellovibrionales bacterium]|nr:SulP family inorganic anion transporter [Bdellovibrionales bacterium]
MAEKSLNQAAIYHDLNASVMVFFVALPLCLGLALASNAPLLSGLLAGIVGGLVVAPLSGSPLSVSGPAAGLVVIVSDALVTLGSYEVFVLAVAVAGAMQIFLSVARAGFLASFFPASVIRGILVAIGLILILKQLSYLVGFNSPQEGMASFATAFEQGSVEAVLSLSDYFEVGSLVIGLLALTTLLLFDKYKTPNRNFPIALIVVTVGTLLAKLLGQIDPDWSIAESHFVNIPVIQWADLTSSLTLPDLKHLGSFEVYQTAAVIAAVASIETLMCIDAVDKLDPLKRSSNFNRELTAQGIGNLVSGMVGGLPLTAVIGRSSANVAAGAKTRAASFFHGVLLLFSVLIITPIMNEIPLSVLAAILIVVGLRLTKPAIYFEMWSRGLNRFLPFIATVFFVVYLDLLTGMLIGIVTAITLTQGKKIFQRN